MGRQFDFQQQWPDIARQVDGLLVRCRVPEALREDLIQETAVRLLIMVERIDPVRSVAALAKKIAINLLRDHIRREKHVVPIFDLDLVGEIDAVETQVIARDEWRRVSKAIAQLQPAQRAALLTSIGAPAPEVGASSSALRVLRMRARRQLRVLLDAMSRGKDACGLALQEGWGNVASRKGTLFLTPSGNQLAQVGTVALAALVVSFASVGPGDLPARVKPAPVDAKVTSLDALTWTPEQGGPVFGMAEGSRLVSSDALAAAKPRAERRRREVTGRIRLGSLGYVEGEDDQVIGVLANNLDEVTRTLRRPTSVMDDVTERCGLGLSSCQRAKGR